MLNCTVEFSAQRTLRQRGNIKEEIATLTRTLPKFNYHPSLLEGYTACILIPLDKNLVVRPIGVGEVSRRIIGNVSGGDKGGSWPTASLRRSQRWIRSSHIRNESGV